MVVFIKVLLYSVTPAFKKIWWTFDTAWFFLFCIIIV